MNEELQDLKEKARRQLLLRIAEQTQERRAKGSIYNQRGKDTGSTKMCVRDLQYASLVYENLGAERLLDISIPFSALKVICGFESKATQEYLLEKCKKSNKGIGIPISVLRTIDKSADIDELNLHLQ